MKIDTSKAKLIFEFQVNEWFLVSSDEKETLWPYTLNYRIDRSGKGKDDDLGVEKIYLSEDEAEQAKKLGFSEIIKSPPQQ